MSEHTPGPWTIESPLSDQMSIVEAGKLSHEWRFIAQVDNGDLEDGFPQEVAEANAKLIAAAPDLLEALQNLAYYATRIAPPPYGHRCMWCEDCRRKAVSAARAALAKASPHSVRGGVA